jgi:transposase-like protein
MTTNQQIKAPMHAAKASPDSGASQGAPRATEDAPESAPKQVSPVSDTEVVPRARRRTFTKGERRRILQEADQCTKPGQLGALMRREGIYSSSLSTWRRQRDAADLDALAPKKRGPKVDLAARSDALQIAQLTRERDKLLVELSKAQLVIEVQKKVTALLDLLAADNKRGST